MTQTRPTRISLCWSVSLDWERESRIKHLKLCTLKVIVSHFPGPVFAGSRPSENRLSGHPESCQQMSPVLEVARVGGRSVTRENSHRCREWPLESRWAKETRSLWGPPRQHQWRRHECFSCPAYPEDGTGAPAANTALCSRASVVSRDSHRRRWRTNIKGLDGRMLKPQK